MNPNRSPVLAIVQQHCEEAAFCWLRRQDGLWSPVYRREHLARVDQLLDAHLEGLRVVNVDGTDFGTVSHLFSTGANDVLVARGDRERLIPFVDPDYIRSVDFEAGVVTVDWDPEF